MTKSADEVVLDKVIEEYHQQNYPAEHVDAVFERYAATEVLRPHELTGEELEAGIVDGEKDGGIDAFYVFLNGVLLEIDDPVLIPDHPSLNKIPPRPSLEVFLIQAKNTASWQENVWEHLLYSLDRLMDISGDPSSLEATFNTAVVERTGILRKALVSLGLKFPVVNFTAAYVTRAPEQNLTQSIVSRAAQVEDLIASKLTSGATVECRNVGITELYRLAGAEPAGYGRLAFQRLIRERDSFVGVVSIQDYLSFVRNEVGGELRQEFFDSNVRDYEGDNAVNEAIRDTLANDDTSEFWWLNNGVTVLGDAVDSPQDTLTISRPLIVNGLQTTHVIHNADKDGILTEERRQNGLVVRVVVSSDDDVRDRIIAGTNRQTRVAPPALYATQPLQRDIERFLYVHGWFYERRKNQYRNLKKPVKRRISVNLLAQTLITLKLGQPDIARARPSSLLTSEEGYLSIFPATLDRSAYLRAVEMIKAVDDYLKSPEAKAVLDDYSNSRFYVAAGYMILKLRLRQTDNMRFEHNHHRLLTPLTVKTLRRALETLESVAQSYAAKRPELTRDAIFKSSTFRDAYFQELVTMNRPKK